MADGIRLIYEEEQKEQRELTQAFKRVFCTPDGELVLMHLLNRLGYFATDETAIRPELTAVANWILMEMGAYSTDEKLQQFVGGIIRSAKGDE